MSSRRFVATAPIGPSAIEILSPTAPVVTAPSTDDQTLMGLLDDTIGLIARGEARITGRMIEACDDLVVIGRSGAGFDTVDIETATARKIPVVFAPVGGFAVAEGALSLLLALIKQLPRCDRIVKSGQWLERYDFESGDMAEHTLGIVGLGRIGARLVDLARPFETTILGYDPLADQAHLGKLGIELVSFEELLQRSDYVSVHVPLNDQTRGLINRKAVAAMKPGAILINTSRGGVVESLDVLAEGLESGQLGSVGLDVFPVEPPDVSHRIFKHPHLLCAPHQVAVSQVAMRRIFTSMATDMVAVVEGRQPRFCVNPEVLDGT